MTRAEHMAWCKARALEYVDTGDLADAVASMISDLGKHEETFKPALLPVYALGAEHAARGDVAAVREWVEGFA